MKWTPKKAFSWSFGSSKCALAPSLGLESDSEGRNAEAAWMSRLKRSVRRTWGAQAGCLPSAEGRESLSMKFLRFRSTELESKRPLSVGNRDSAGTAVRTLLWKTVRGQLS